MHMDSIDKIELNTTTAQKIAELAAVSETPLDSSCVSLARYDAKQKTLELEFVSGARYRYTGVPRETYDELMLAKSAGAYFGKSIRPRYPSTKL